MVFEAIHGGGVAGDIAIDDITYTWKFFGCYTKPTNAKWIPPTTPPPPPPPTTAPPPDAHDCTFDKDLCRYVNDPTGQFNWTRHQGSTSSTNTGPKRITLSGNMQI